MCGEGIMCVFVWGGYNVCGEDVETGACVQAIGTDARCMCVCVYS